MNIKAWNALLVIALLLVLGGGGYILYMSQKIKESEIAAEQAKQQAAALEEAEKELARKNAMYEQFEGFLNGFLRNVYEQMQDYKQNRIVLNELLKPANLREAQYIEENTQLAENTVVSLRQQMDEIIGLFKAADEQIKPLIAQFEEAEQPGMTKSWEEMRDTNSQKFMNYFQMEQDVLDAQLALMQFYNAHRDVMEVDVINGHVMFEDVALQEEEALLRGRILELKSMQKDILSPGQGGDTQAVEDITPPLADDGASTLETMMDSLPEGDAEAAPAAMEEPAQADEVLPEAVEDESAPTAETPENEEPAAETSGKDFDVLKGTPE